MAKDKKKKTKKKKTKKRRKRVDEEIPFLSYMQKRARLVFRLALALIEPVINYFLELTTKKFLYQKDHGRIC